MTNPTESDWYQEMAAAMKRRDHAIKMIERWTKVRQEAETDIQDLFAKNRDGEAATEQE